jgi:hypothetical protein
MRFTRVLLLVALAALVVVPAAFALRFTDDSYNMPQGFTGQGYSKTFGGAGGCGPALPYQYRVLSGALPQGLSLSTGGTISGVPTVGGSYDFWIELSDENPPSASWCRPSTAQREFTIVILQGLNIKQNALSPKVTATNAPYSFQLTTDGGSASQSWSVVSGALPPGVTLGSNGVISGTPTATGDYTFKIQVTDGGRTDAETYTLSVVDPLKLSPSPPTTGEVGIAFTYAPATTGGRPGYTFSTDGAMPAGLAFDATTGAITGKPTIPGTYTFKLIVTDSLGLTQTANVNLVVSQRLLITKRPFKAAKVGTAYKVTLLARGGVTPRTWNLLGGRPGFLPQGMKLNRRTGVISGTPTKAGTYYLRLQVVDKLGAKSAAPYVLKVNA